MSRKVGLPKNAENASKNKVKSYLIFNKCKQLFDKTGVCFKVKLIVTVNPLGKQVQSTVSDLKLMVIHLTGGVRSDEINTSVIKYSITKLIRLGLHTQSGVHAEITLIVFEQRDDELMYINIHSWFLIGSCSKPRRRPRRECHQTKGLMSGTVVLHVRFESWYISCPSSAKQHLKMTKFYVFWRTRTTMANFWYVLLELNAVGAWF